MSFPVEPHDPIVIAVEEAPVTPAPAVTPEPIAEPDAANPSVTMPTSDATNPTSPTEDTPPAPEPTEAEPTKKQRRAARNRANAKHSTGPKTPEGKLRSRANAIKHGATCGVIHGIQARAEAGRYSRQLKTDYQPQTTLEHESLDRLVINQYRLLSLNQQISTLEHALSQEAKGVPERSPIHGRLALLRMDAPEKFVELDRLYRYRRDNDRDYVQSTGALTRLQRARQIHAIEEAAETRRSRHDRDNRHFDNSTREAFKREGLGFLSNTDHMRLDQYYRQLEEREKERVRQLAEEERLEEEAAEARRQQQSAADREQRPAKSENEPTQPEPNQPLLTKTDPQR